MDSNTETELSADVIKQAEEAKAQGNQLFEEEKFDEAVKQYTKAIELTNAKPNHIYYSNRANAYLSQNKWAEAIADCD
jgi:tetratricopeptide (TPR) repeat protein